MQPNGNPEPASWSMKLGTAWGRENGFERACLVVVVGGVVAMVVAVISGWSIAPHILAVVASAGAAHNVSQWRRHRRGDDFGTFPESHWVWSVPAAGGIIFALLSIPFFLAENAAGFLVLCFGVALLAIAEWRRRSLADKRSGLIGRRRNP
jgi:hypothetical protein